jgi:hypothetical protein
MRGVYWVIGACLGLLLVGGLAVDVSARQPAPPASPFALAAPAETGPDAAQRSLPSPATLLSAQMRQHAEGSKVFGVEPIVALIFGMVLLVLVAMSRRPEDVDHTHHRV